MEATGGASDPSRVWKISQTIRRSSSRRSNNQDSDGRLLAGVSVRAGEGDSPGGVAATGASRATTASIVITHGSVTSSATVPRSGVIARTLRSRLMGTGTGVDKRVVELR